MERGSAHEEAKRSTGPPMERQGGARRVCTGRNMGWSLGGRCGTIGGMKSTIKLLAAIVALPLCGCAQDSPANDKTESAAMPKTLVAYFSATGTTKGVAERLAGAIGAAIVDLVPEKPYTAADLDWRDKTSRSSVEMADRASRPAIVGAVTNFADYATVYVGFPIWWYREPSVIDTFVESNAAALAGKTVVPFATSGGSGMGDSTANLQALAPEAKVENGRRFRGTASADDLADWARPFAKPAP